MNKTDLIKQIASAISKAAKKVDPKVKVVGGKMTAALGAAKLVDDAVLDKIPGLKKAMIWTDDKITQGQKWLVDNTLGKIPGVGPIITKLHDAGTKGRQILRDVIFGDNDPSWYEHLPQHVTFQIPGGYNNKMVKFQTGGSSYTTIPSVATINMIRNIITTSYATTSRYSEIYTAVKYARGLSYLPYSVNQLALMFEIGNEMAVLYYRLAKAVSAAFHFSLTKANVPNMILSGLNVSDVIDNYEKYVTLLDQMYNYMSVNVPMLPLMHKKLRQMCLFTALDSEKPAMSTYLQAFVFNNVIQVNEDGEGFYTGGVSAPNTIADCRTQFQSYRNLLSASTNSTSQMLNVIADVKGAIAGVDYVVNWRTIKFEDTFTTDKLFLNSIKNMDLVPTFGLVGTYQGSQYGFVCDKLASVWQGSSSNPIKVSTGASQSVILRFKSEQTAANQEISPTYVCCSGSKNVKAFAKNIVGASAPYSFDLSNGDYAVQDKLVSLDGTEASEGATLETISLGYLVKSCSIEAPSGTSPCYASITIDPSLFIGIDIQVINDYDSTETKSLKNTLEIPGWDLPGELYNRVTSWTLVDWMPCIYCTTFVSAAQFYTAILWDINGIGSLNRSAIETAIDYITYSLLYPGNVEALNKVELANKLINSLKTK